MCSADAENYSDTDEMLAPDERELDLELESRPPARRVATRQSPYFKAFYRSHPVQLTIDSGAETNMISLRTAKYLEADIDKSSQVARQADGVTSMDIVGETHISLARNGIRLQLDALVVRELDVDILADYRYLIAI